MEAQAPLSLMDAVKVCLKSNFKIQITWKRNQISQNNNSWGKAGRIPTLSLRFNSIHSAEDNSDTGEYTWFHQNSPGINMQWTLFRGFAIYITKEKLDALNRLSEGNAALMIENTVQGVILAYYKVLLEQEMLNTLEEMVKLSESRYQHALNKKEVGAATTYETLQAKISWQSDQAAHLLQQSNKKNAQRNLNLLMGVDTEEIYSLTEPFEVDLQEFSIKILLSKLKENNQSLKNQYINQEILKKELKLKRSALYPTLALNTGYDHPWTRITGQSSQRNEFYINFSVNLTLFDGGNIRRDIKNAQIESKIGELEIKEMEMSLTHQLRSSFELYNVQTKLLQVALEQIKSAKLNLEISTEKYKSGAINSFNFRDVQILYRNVVFQKHQTLYNLIATQTELLKLTGAIMTPSGS